MAKNNEKKRSSGKGLSGALDKLAPKVGQSLPVRMLCYFGCADEKFRRSAKTSRIMQWFDNLRLYHRFVCPCKRYFARSVENSRVLDILRRFLNFFYILPILYYGVMLFSAGLTVCGASAVVGFMEKVDLTSLALFDLPMMIPGLVMLLTAVPLLLTDNEPLSTLVEQSHFCRKFLCEFLGLDPVCLRRRMDQVPSGGGLFMLALLVGVAVGVFTRYVSAVLLPLIVLYVVLFVIVMTAPEAGLMMICVLLPFMAPKNLVYLCILVLFSFAVKLLRGKRSLKLTMTDVCFLLLAALIFFECILHDSGRDYGYAAILFLLIAVTGSHLLRSHGVADRFLRAMMLSSFVAIGVLAIDIGIGFVPSGMLRQIPIAEFTGAIIANFGSRGDVGLYLFLTFPFVMTSFYLSGKMSTRFSYLVYFVLFLGAFVVTKSRVILVGSVILVAMYLLMRSMRHLLTLLFGGTAALLVYFFLLPARYADYIARAFAGWDDNFMAGLSEFGSVFVGSAKRMFAGVGFEQAEGKNLYTILLSALGLVGFVMFIALMLLLIGYATVSTVRNRNSSPRLYPLMIACYTSVFGALFIATRLPVLDCPVVLLSFCLICGYTMGLGRTMRKNAVLAEAVTEEDIEFSPIFHQGGDRYE